MLQSFSYVKATSMEEATRQLAEGGARVHAGGTDLLGCLRDDVFEVDRVVSITSLPGLRGVRATSDGGLSIGALTPIAEVAANELVNERARALAQAAGEVGTPQLRNQGTLGGNLCQKPRCWYYRGPFDCRRKGGERCFAVLGNNEGHAVFGGMRCYIAHPSDTAPALVALGATARLEGPDGVRRVPLEDFFVLPEQDHTRENVLQTGEVLTEVVVPAPGEGMTSSYAKVRGRRSWDFALAGVALALGMASDGTVRRARVVFSGVAPAPWRSAPAEAVITGRRLTDDVIREAGAASVEDAQPMAHNGYKVPMMRSLLERELSAAVS
jgi:xanthine dehydrogenase YagS FAD-binding subunit